MDGIGLAFVTLFVAGCLLGFVVGMLIGWLAT